MRVYSRLELLFPSVQYEEATEIPMGVLEEFKAAESDIHPEYGRIVLRRKDAPVISTKEAGAFLAKRQDEYALTMAKEMRIPGVPRHCSRSIQFMGAPENGFKDREVEITSLTQR